MMRGHAAKCKCAAIDIRRECITRRVSRVKFLTSDFLDVRRLDILHDYDIRGFIPAAPAPSMAILLWHMMIRADYLPRHFSYNSYH